MTDDADVLSVNVGAIRPIDIGVVEAQSLRQ